jgi:hypothetical protein
MHVDQQFQAILIEHSGVSHMSKSAVSYRQQQENDLAEVYRFERGQVIEHTEELLLRWRHKIGLPAKSETRSCTSSFMIRSFSGQFLRIASHEGVTTQVSYRLAKGEKTS